LYIDRSTANKRFVVFWAIFLLFASASLLWLRLHRAPPNWDDAWYLSNSLTLYDSWVGGGLPGLAKQFLAALGFKAPLITALPLPFYWLLGRRWHAAYLANMFSMLVLFAAVCAIGRRIRGQRAGLIAAYIAGSLPLLYGLSRWYLVEYPLAAVMALTFWLTLCARDESVGSAAALGVVCGVGLLLKADYPLFAGPMVAMAVTKRRDRPRAILAICVPAAMLAAPWYALHWWPTLRNAVSAGFGKSALVQGTGPIFSPVALWKYLGIVAEWAISPYYLGLAFVAAAITAWKRDFGVFRELRCLLPWLAPFLVFAFGGNKDVRYIAPIVPAVAVGAACLLDGVIANRRWILPMVLAFPLISLCAVSFGWPYQARDIGYANHYEPHPWRQDEILARIEEMAAAPFARQRVLLLGTDRGSFNADNFQLFALQERLPLRVETTAYGQSLEQLLQQASGAEYFVYKEGGERESDFFNLHAEGLRRALQASDEWVEIPFGARLPDGGTAHILRRVHAQQSDLGAGAGGTMN